MSKNIWDSAFDNLDWDAIDREVKKFGDADEARQYFSQSRYDYKRGYIRKLMQAHPEITDIGWISAATEQMMESHEAGVELDVDDALRFTAGEKPMSVDDVIRALGEAGINDGNIMDVIFNAEDDGKRGTVINPQAKHKAEMLERYANMLAKNKDVVILGLPVLEHEADWTQVKLAIFTDDMSTVEEEELKKLMSFSDKYFLDIEHGVAVATFQIYDIWSDFK